MSCNVDRCDSLGMIDHCPRNDGTAPDKAGNRGIGRRAIDLLRRSRLQHLASAHNGNAIGQCQGLGLVVGDIDDGGAGAAMDVAKRVDHRRAQMHVEIGERFVEQDDPGVGDQTARQRDALTLAAG